MRELINFFVNNIKWVLFITYMVISGCLLFTRNPYQQHVWLTSAGAASGTVYNAANNVTSYFNLRDNNEDLNRRNAELQRELIAMRQQSEKLREALSQYDTTLHIDAISHYDFIVANVVNNSVIHPHNYITINRGKLDGITPEMGVIDQNGVVGIVNVVSDHYARVISLLNPHFRLSCKLKKNDSFGSLVWDGKDPRYAVLEELPHHAKFAKGDTVVTSGYSTVFPQGLPIGVIVGSDGKGRQTFNSLKIKLFTDFTALNNVQVIVSHDAAEIRQLNEANDRIEGNEEQ